MLVVLTHVSHGFPQATKHNFGEVPQIVTTASSPVLCSLSSSHSVVCSLEWLTASLNNRHRKLSNWLTTKPQIHQPHYRVTVQRVVQPVNLPIELRTRLSSEIKNTYSGAERGGAARSWCFNSWKQSGRFVSTNWITSCWPLHAAVCVFVP
jgi:hypothetical protein